MASISQGQYSLGVVHGSSRQQQRGHHVRTLYFFFSAITSERLIMEPSMLGNWPTHTVKHAETAAHPIAPSTPVYAFYNNEDLLPRPVRAGLPFHHRLPEESFQVGHV